MQDLRVPQRSREFQCHTIILRVYLLYELLARARPEEQDFLVRLLFGDLRQGALEGIMIEAIAKGTRIPAADIRRGVMVSGDLGAVAFAALEQGGKSRFKLEPEAVALKLVHAVESPRPKRRYYVTVPTYMAAWAKRLLPPAAADFLAKRT